MNHQEEEEDAAWDELCLDPQKSALGLGREAGKEAGLAAGWNDGLGVGVTTGIEHGMDVGFMNGVLQEVLMAMSEQPDAFGDSSSRIQKTAEALSQRLEGFPSPEELFQQGVGIGASSAEALPIDDDSEQQEEDETHHNNASSLDHAQRMQGIRSKFKLLAVQLRWRNYSLKTVLEDAVVATLPVEIPSNPDDAAAAAAGGGTVDW